jgi:hypothetical protein
MTSPGTSLRAALLEFCADAWSQLGVAVPRRGTVSPIAIDLEPLLLLTLEVARDDPRLFDEVLDWCATNASLLSPHRLRTLCADDTDRRMVEALTAWLRGPSTRLAPPVPLDDAVVVFPGLASPVDLDPSFASAGLLRPPVAPSGKSRAPDLLAPACIGLRLRVLFGTDARAEVARLMLTVAADRIDIHVLYRGAGFSSKRVREAALRFVDAGTLGVSGTGGRMLFSRDLNRWTTWLDLPRDRLPKDGDWPQLLRACTRLARAMPQLEANADPYLRASDARQLWNLVEDDLRYAGAPMVAGAFAAGEDYWEQFCGQVDAVTSFVRGQMG